MTTEVRKYIPPQEWKYLEGVLDQGLVFGVWPHRRESSFVHRVELFNTSRRLVYLLQDYFGGKVGERHHQEANPPARKVHYVWSIASAEKGLEFLDLAQDHLHFKRDLAKKYADCLQALLDKEDITEQLPAFRETKASPPSAELYLPTPRNLAGRLDTDGFIDIHTRPNASLSRAHARVRLGTKFPGLGLALKQEYGGSSAPHRWAYFWTVDENQAANVLKTVLPYLRNMKARATLVLEFEAINKLLSRKGRGVRQTDLLHSDADLLRLSYIEHSRQLNANPV